MKHIYLLTGPPGVGKTTLLKEAVSASEKRAGGFITSEIRIRKSRQGFEIRTFHGSSGVLAHVDFDSPFRVSKYGVNMETLNDIGVASLRRAISKDQVIVIDEIGKMELLSMSFRDAVLETFDCGKKVLGTIMLAPHPWADRIKKDSRVKLVTLTKTNYQDTLADVKFWLARD